MKAILQSQVRAAHARRRFLLDADTECADERELLGKGPVPALGLAAELVLRLESSKQESHTAQCPQPHPRAVG